MSPARAFARVFLLSQPFLFASAPVMAADPVSAQCAPAYENAQLLRQRGKLVQARDQANVCAQNQCPEVARKDCAHWAEELGRAVPSVVVVVRDEAEHDIGAARLLVDGTLHPEASTGRAFELDPGAHVFRVERPNAAAIERPITVYQGERDRLVHITVPGAPGSATLPPQAAAPTGNTPAPARPSEGEPPPTYTATAIVGGLTVASLGLSAYLGLTGRFDLSQLRTSCAPSCTDAQVDPVRTRLTLSDVALGAGLVGAAITVYLFAHTTSERNARTSLSVSVAPVRDGAGAVFGGRF